MSAGAQTPKIIVSYRRTDAAMAGRIFDRLVQRFGKKSLFIDIDNIPFGGDFRRHIDDALKSSDLLIALVGPRWAGGEGKDAKITREADPVRVEIETALKQNITVLPVLLDEARMPEPSELPESIREFAYRNAAEVESGRDFDIHVDRLIKAVEQILGSKAAPEVQAATTHSAATLISPAPVARRAPSAFPCRSSWFSRLPALRAAFGRNGRRAARQARWRRCFSNPVSASTGPGSERTFRTGPPIRSSHWAG